MNIMTSQLGMQNTSSLRNNMALALVGRSVSLRGQANDIIHGKVTSVQFEFGAPRILVGNGAYDLDQVITSVPIYFNS